MRVVVCAKGTGFETSGTCVLGTRELTLVHVSVLSVIREITIDDSLHTTSSFTGDLSAQRPDD